MTAWAKKLIEWKEGDTAHISVVFSWQIQEAWQRAVWFRQQGTQVVVGGPAAEFQADVFDGIATFGKNTGGALVRHNPDATFTSRGCIRKCKFCLVPKVEGDLRELRDWPIRPIVCDNNLLACSRAHFGRVVDKLIPLRGVDFNQGLDARLLTTYHADRLRQLRLSILRMAWDNTAQEKEVLHAFHILRTSGFPASLIRIYVLIGHHDTPADALYRLEMVRSLGAWPVPMRYQPLDAIKKNAYIGPNWTDVELKDFMRFWSRQAWLGGVSFDEYSIPKKRYIHGEEQSTLEGMK